MSPDRIRQNEQVLSRLSARREVRRLRTQKKKVSAELLARAGFSDGAVQPTSRKQKVSVTLDSKSGPVQVKVNRQTAAKALGIKNRRWMNAAELDEAIRYATSCHGNRLTAEGVRLAALEQRGRERCHAAWEAWKLKQPKEAGA